MHNISYTYSWSIFERYFDRCLDSLDTARFERDGKRYLFITGRCDLARVRINKTAFAKAWVHAKRRGVIIEVLPDGATNYCDHQDELNQGLF